MQKPKIPIDIALETATCVFRQLIRDGNIDPRGKTPEQLFTAFKHIVEDDRYVFQIVTDYTPDLLREARQRAKAGGGLEALMFYATWVEHTLNGMIASLARRLSLGESIGLDLIRHTRLNEKFVWLHAFLVRRAPARLQITRLQQLAERRNQFIHYKWRAEPERLDYSPHISSAEKLVGCIQRFHDKHFLYGKRRLTIRKP